MTDVRKRANGLLGTSPGSIWAFPAVATSPSVAPHAAWGLHPQPRPQASSLRICVSPRMCGDNRKCHKRTNVTWSLRFVCGRSCSLSDPQSLLSPQSICFFLTFPKFSKPVLKSTTLSPQPSSL
uniref:Uncharacterized protein n=1 Tax=Rousettus aegyptiacus TaxID=9407 RepID=A0A7J8BRV7_ROUAE|nr:hypothetical protein HJG63_009574 [Rousettus aegyptiacus]